MQVLKSEEYIAHQQATQKLLTTNNFKAVQRLCSDAYNNAKMIGLIGEPGYGKTSSLKHFQTTKENVFYLTVKKSMTAKSFWESMFDIVPESIKLKYGLDNHRRAIHYIIRSVCDLLNGFDKALLIVDEAGKFNTQMLEYIHELRDETLTTTGIILSGPPYFKRNLSKWVHQEKIGMPEVWRRINYWHELSAPQRNEVKEFCRHYGINDAEVIRQLSGKSGNFGSLNNMIVEYLSSNQT
jgi:DNA transposition AAA+ family ATPase